MLPVHLWLPEAHVEAEYKLKNKNFSTFMIKIIGFFKRKNNLYHFVIVETIYKNIL